MKILPLVKSEFARLTASKLGIASLIALMTVPLFYGGLYLWGNQDPYKNLDRVPAALVVSDTGATVDGTAVNYGRSAAKTLLDGKRFGWHEVTEAQAKKGVENGTYDFAVGFPSDFSTKLASISGDSPESARLDLLTDDTNSYLSTTIAKSAVETVRVSVAKQVGATAAKTLLTAVGDLRSGLVDAGSGASKLSDGAATAATGAASLDTGIAQVASGAASLSSGLSTLDSSVAALPGSAAKLSAGASTLATGLANGAASAKTLQSAAATAASLAPGAAEQQQIIGALTLAGATPETIAQVTAQLAGLQQATAGVSSGISGQLVPSLDSAAAGSAQVATGASALSSSAPSLASAVASAARGAATLSTGAAQAAGGASALSSGVSTLADGTKTLDSSLSDAVTKVPKTTAAERKTTANLIANPVLVDQNALTEAQNYGAGLAPFFLSLSAWIGMYALFLLVRPLSRRALTAVRRPIRTTLAGWITPAALGVLQMIGLFAIVTLGLHLQIANPVGMLGLLALASASFAAIILALNVLLGSVGQFLGLILMVVQLVTAGGTFPWQTLPGPLAALHQALPMSHAVDGIRQLMYGGTGADLWSAVGPLLAWLVAGLAASAYGAWKQGRSRTLRELRPSAIGG